MPWEKREAEGSASLVAESLRPPAVSARSGPAPEKGEGFLVFPGSSGQAVCIGFAESGAGVRNGDLGLRGVCPSEKREREPGEIRPKDSRDEKQRR